MLTRPTPLPSVLASSSHAPNCRNANEGATEPLLPGLRIVEPFRSGACAAVRTGSASRHAVAMQTSDFIIMSSPPGTVWAGLPPQTVGAPPTDLLAAAGRRLRRAVRA